MPTASVASSSPSDTPPSATQARTATISVSGDLLWHEPLWEAARTDDGFDFRAQLDGLTPALANADLAVCHQEVPVARPGGPYSDYPTFRSPAETVDAVAAAGFDLCTTASNHTMDDGWDGLVRTRETLEAAGLGAVGTYTTRSEAQSPHLFTTDQGVKVAIVSQTYGLNGIPKTPGREWSVDLLDPDKAVADARRARAAGADIVIFHMHAGTEYEQEPDSNQRYMAAMVTASGEFDLVMGQHPHVVQPIEKVNGVWTVFSTGNLMAAQRRDTPQTDDGMLVDISFRETPSGRFTVDRVQWAPTHISRPGEDADGIPRVRVIPDALPEASGPTRKALQDSAARTRSVVGAHAPEGLVERTEPLV
ncbi:CapA family protein [Micrococcus lylae]|uniref:CapA family protein n=1 Tax=Micrococcus TaxID=1269 RepID=UPI00187D413E|nr:CapA family protein [Micrococcus sp. FDAARGOS_333]